MTAAPLQVFNGVVHNKVYAHSTNQVLQAIASVYWSVNTIILLCGLQAQPVREGYKGNQTFPCWTSTTRRTAEGTLCNENRYSGKVLIKQNDEGELNNCFVSHQSYQMRKGLLARPAGFQETGNQSHTLRSFSPCGNCPKKNDISRDWKNKQYNDTYSPVPFTSSCTTSLTSFAP